MNLEQQLELEITYKHRAESIIRQIYEDTPEYSKGLQVVTRRTVQSLIDNYTEIFMNIQSKQRGRGATPVYHYILHQLFEYMSPRELAEICGLFIISTAIRDSFKRENVSRYLTMNCDDLKNEINIVIYTTKYSDYGKEIKRNLERNLCKLKTSYLRKEWLNKYYNDKEYTPLDFEPVAFRSFVTFLLYTMEETGIIKISTNNSKYPIIEPSEEVESLMEKCKEFQIDEAYKKCPLIIPPLPYSKEQAGGYYGALQGCNSLLRLRRSPSIFQQSYLKQLRHIDMDDVYNVLNSIQQTAWKVNNKILDVLDGFATREVSIDCIPMFHQVELPLVDNWDELSTDQKNEIKKQRFLIHKSNVKNASIFSRFKATITGAKEFSVYDKFYHAWNMDWRGRIYPHSTLLSPQGMDLEKALLLFAEPKPLENIDNLKYFYRHGAGLCGVDKVSYEEREKYIQEGHELWINIANNPYEYTEWSKMDEPFQFLAWCFEYKSLQDYIAINKTAKGWVTGIVIAFDGSCSGLQHFSAILRDEVGASAVNLLPSDTPQDIYGIVAKKVNERLQQDAINGTLDYFDEDKNSYKLGTTTLAQQWLSFGVTRKVTKRPVMTLAYGASKFGYKEQIMDDTITPAISDKGCTIFSKPIQAGLYMAEVIWDCVKDTVVSAVSGMQYLKDLTKLVVSNDEVVSWSTPFGLPVQQDYLKNDIDIKKVTINGRQVRVYNITPTCNIDKRQQVSAVAPNFIHSLDACHLQMVVKESVANGITSFALIHDSFGCCLEDSDRFNCIIRQQMVKLYTDNDVLEDFTEEMKMYIPEDEWENIPELPARGSFNLENILKSEYCFS